MKKKLYSKVRFVQSSDEDYNRIEAVFSGLKAGFVKAMPSQSLIISVIVRKKPMLKFIDIKIMVTKEITKELVEKQMNSTLSYFPWGGKVIAVRQNEWGEWIADCKIPGHYSRDCDGPGGHYYRMEDADCPIRQFMVVLEYQEARFEMEPWWLTRYWEAANNMREPTFPESMDFFDPNAPRSPYILAKIKASMEKHHTLCELQEMWDNFSNTPINNDDEIEMPFYFWESGTSRFEIWHWFDKLCPNGLAVDLMGETPKTVF